MKKLGIIILICLCVTFSNAQKKTITLSLESTIELACDSSLEAFRIQNSYWVSSWQYTVYKANRLPSLFLELTPGEYYRNIIKRYDYNSNMDVYRPQQSFEARGGLSINQNFDWLGGTFFINSDLTYNRNFGDNTYTQFTSVPFRIGYQQSLIGFNSFKWEKKIEPLKFKKAKKQLIYDIENISSVASNYFFQIAMAQEEYNLALENTRNMDTLYSIALERAKIVAISQTDLQTLRLDRLNAYNSLENANINLKRAKFNIVSYLNIDKDVEVSIILPDHPKTFSIPIEKALKEAQNNNPSLIGYKQNILENQRIVDQKHKESLFNASFYASMGFNQVASRFSLAYQDLMRQDVLSLRITVPLIDWGVRKGEYNMAKNNLNIAEISAKQGEESLEEDVMMTIADFEIQKKGIVTTQEAMSLSNDIYAQEMQRFIIGKADLNTLTLAHQRVQNARKNYISSLANYWSSYFKIRKLTLYDFENDLPLNYMIENKILNK